MDYSNEFKDLIDLNNLSERLNDLIYSSEYKPKFQLNLLDTIGVRETLVSKIMSLMFNYKSSGKYILFQSFVEEFLRDCGFDTEWIQNPRIMAETTRIDISIQEQGKYAIIIENKVKGAPFQHNQIARYIQKMRNLGYTDDRIFIVVLPHYADKLLFEQTNKSVWCLPDKDFECYKDKYSCKCDYGEKSDYCNKCEKDLKDKFKNRTVVLDATFIYWLENKCLSLLPSDEHLLHSSIVQFVDFLKGVFNIRFNDQLNMEIKEFLRQQLIDSNESLEVQRNIIEKKIDKVKELIIGLEKLQKSIDEKLVDEWREQLMPEWESYGLRYEENKSFGIKIENFWCGCWYLEKEKTIWGFQCNSSEQKDTDEKKVEKILELAGYEGESKKIPGFIKWGNTKNGFDICNDFYRAAVDCGFLKKIESN